MNDILRRPTPKPQPPSNLSGPTPPPVVEPGLTLPPKKRRIWPWVLGILGFFVLLAAAAAIAGYLWYKNAITPVSTSTQPITVVVESGETSEQIAQKLEELGLVRSALATQIYMQLSGVTVKAGHYVLEPNQSVAEIVDWLASGRVDTFKVTILPDRTLKELKVDLQKYGYTAEELNVAFTKTYDHPLFAGSPPKDIEGYIYPETYFVTLGSSAEDLLVRTFDEFEKQLEQHDIRAQLQARGFSLHQGVILASIVSHEVPGAEDRRKVAQVFEKRLQEGMPLGSDVTFIYAAQQLGIEPLANLDSPYNTRIHAGLPPGPIGNVTFAPLLAVVQPANTTYLYFVAGDDGITRFSFTAEEHESNVQKYCRKLCGLE